MPDPDHPLAALAGAVSLLAETVHAQAHPGCASRDVSPAECESGNGTFRLIADQVADAVNPMLFARRLARLQRLVGRLEGSPHA
jgi:hypothetical protein